MVMSMIKPLLSDRALLNDIKSHKQKDDGLRLWWLGQSGFLLLYNGLHILVDPYLSDSLTRKYEQTDKPHIRMSEKVILPEQLDFIDVVTSSHNHTDHLDPETLKPIIDTNPEVIVVAPRANLELVSERSGRSKKSIWSISDGESISPLPGLSIHGIPAAHNALDRDGDGNCRFMGFVFRMGPYTVYHSGDTLTHPEIENALRHFEIDIAILPINGNKPERRVAGNLNAKEALQLSAIIGAKWIIPCHYHMFAFNTVDPDEFIQLADESGQQIKVFQIGEGWTLPV